MTDKTCILYQHLCQPLSVCAIGFKITNFYAHYTLLLVICYKITFTLITVSYYTVLANKLHTYMFMLTMISANSSCFICVISLALVLWHPLHPLAQPKEDLWYVTNLCSILLYRHSEQPVRTGLYYYTLLECNGVMNQQGTNFLVDSATSNFRAEDARTLKMATAGSSKNSGTFPQI